MHTWRTNKVDLELYLDVLKMKSFIEEYGEVTFCYSNGRATFRSFEFYLNWLEDSIDFANTNIVQIRIS